MVLGIGPHGPIGPHRSGEEGGSYPDGREAGSSAGPSAVRNAPASDLERPGPADRDAMAVIASVEGIGPVTLERLLATFGGPAAALAAARSEHGAADVRSATRGADDRWPSMRASTAAAMRAAALEPETVLASMAAAGVHVLLLDDEAYPRRLREIALPPRLLFVRGDDAALDAADVVAVVGTRRPTDEGRSTAARIGAALARAGALVVSGLALGVDGAAHAAVVGERGRTVAVIGGGHDRLFPAAHDRLAEAIVDSGGAVVSEHAPGTKPSKGTFPRRNRIISGLADAVVVVEAGARSGALVTAAWALEQGRECFLVPGSIDAPQSAGCLAWLRDYAGAARIVAGVPQLLEDLELDALAALPAASREDAVRWGPHRTGARRAAVGTTGALRPQHGRPAAASMESVGLDMPDRERRVLLALDRGAATVDELAAVTALPIGAVLAGLTGLEGRGLVEDAYGRYRIPAEVVARAARANNPAA
jgi:DNA processing protein